MKQIRGGGGNEGWGVETREAKMMTEDIEVDESHSTKRCKAQAGDASKTKMERHDEALAHLEIRRPQSERKPRTSLTRADPS